MIFNKTGKLIRRVFKIGGENLEPVQTFCYLGYVINASGTNRTAIDYLYDKASKAMLPIFRMIARFNIPIKTLIRLFDAYLSPIMLYNVENWGELGKKRLKMFTKELLWSEILDAKASMLHRRFLKYILGVTKSCPNLAVMGDTGETPLMLKGYRLMIQYWYRITNLPNETLVKKALLENIHQRTGWICTIENIISGFNLADSLQSARKLCNDSKIVMKAAFSEYWKSSIVTNGRLEFYNKYKQVFKFEEYLHIPTFDKRKAIAKLRCSDHELEIEKGRHKNILRHARLCKLCDMSEIETEEHFLFECKFYEDIKMKINFNNENESLFSMHSSRALGEFIMLALAKRRDNEIYTITN